MRCPNRDANPECDIPANRYRAPQWVPGVGLVRRHRCPNCHRVFMSLQKTISNWAAEKILDRLEAADSTEQPRTSFEPPTPETTPSSTSETLAS